MAPAIVTSSLLAIGIDACSNVIAQRLEAYRASAAFTFDTTRFLQFMLLVCFTAPMNFCWQNWLERTFPGWKNVTRVGGSGSDAEERRRAGEEGVELLERGGGKEDGLLVAEEGRREDGETVRVRNWWNIFRKWFTDCITLGALLNTTVFLVGMGLIKGKPVGMIAADLKNETFHIIFNSYKVWPPANFISTTFVPVERRIVFLSCCGLIWNIYLSLVAGNL